MLLALDRAEKMYGRPVYVIEIYGELAQVSWMPTFRPYLVWQSVFDLFQNDEILADKYVDQFSLNQKLQRSPSNPESEYELFSDRAVRKWPDYRYNEKMIMKPKENTPVINFDHLKKLLLGPADDQENLKEYNRIVDPDHPKFLDLKCTMKGNRVAFASFPRSGNSFLRKMLEQITGVFTGSDLGMKDVLPLQQQGLLGEETYGDDSIWITKTHFPLKASTGSPFTVDKVICLSRNPIDVIPSVISLGALQSHTLEPNRPWCTFKHWPHIVNYFASRWATYHMRVREQAKVTPTFYATYE